MVIAYWQIGKRIVEEEQQGSERAAYGEYHFKELAHRLTSEFGKGFTVTNLDNFRKFYLVFPTSPILHAVRGELPDSSQGGEGDKEFGHMPVLPQLRGELSWTHYRLLIRVEDETARMYYMSQAADENWSTRVLERQINTLYFERLLSSKNKVPLIEKASTESKQDPPTIYDFVKDPYILEFLQLQPNCER